MRAAKLITLLGGVSNPNLIINGNFALDPINAAQNTTQNGWRWALGAGTGTVVWNSGPNTISLTGDGAHVNALNSIAFTTVAGVSYTLMFDVVSNASAMGAVASTATAGSGTILLNAAPIVGNGQQFTFVATTTTTFLSFQKFFTGTSVFGNVSVKRT